MKRYTGLLLSTISTAAVTAVLGLPDIAAARPAQSPAPIERLASIREAYLATLPEASRRRARRRTAIGSPSSAISRTSPTGEIR